MRYSAESERNMEVSKTFQSDLKRDIIAEIKQFTEKFDVRPTTNDPEIEAALTGVEDAVLELMIANVNPQSGYDRRIIICGCLADYGSCMAHVCATILGDGE